MADAQSVFIMITSTSIPPSVAESERDLQQSRVPIDLYHYLKT